MKARCSGCATTWRFPDSTPADRIVCPDCGARISDSTAASTNHGDLRREIPADIAGYRIVSRIAKGASGSVWRATDGGGRTVALKVLRRGGAPDEEELARFHREAQVLKRLDHPNIVKVHDAGFAGARHFIAMELVDGVSLRDRIASGRLDLREAAAILRDIARALDHAHGRGVVHRDLKPENILLGEAGFPKLSDFGIAKLDGANTRRLTLAGIALGTPEYMSPEQAEGRSHEADLRTDIWSMGVILFECASGKLPFKGRNAPDTLDRIARDPAPLLREVAKKADEGIEAVVATCLARDPGERYATARDLALDLDRWIKGEKVTAPPAGSMSGFLRRILGPKRK